MEPINDSRTDKVRSKFEIFMVPGKQGYSHSFSCFSMKTCCGYSLEVLRQSTSNEYSQDMFFCMIFGINKKNIGTFQLQKVPNMDLPILLTLVLLNNLRFHAHF